MSLSSVLLSGSTDGKQIKVTGTSTAATVTVHTAHATAHDCIYLYVDNDDTTGPVTLTLEMGGTTDPDNLIKKTIPTRGTVGNDGRICVLDGYILTNSQIIKAFASSANKLKLSGKVVRSS